MSGELPPHLKVMAEGMIRASMGLATNVMTGARDTAIGLYHELDRQKGMAGDDDAGRDFAKVYKSAASATLNQMGFSSYLLGESGRGLMRTAREFMARESSIASAILGKQIDVTAGMGDPGADCPENYLGLGRELSEVVGETSGLEQYGTNDRFRGSPEKLRDVAGSWRHAGKLLLRVLEDAQAFASTADKAHSGEAADAFRDYFSMCVGRACPLDRAQPDEPLVTNPVAACNQLAKACDRYADHVEAAKRQIQENKLDLFHLEMPWDAPRFGGNGDDGGLHAAVLEDPWIHQLGDIAHALDASEKRVKLPDGSGDPRGPGVPFLPPLIRVPIPVPLTLAAYAGQPPGIVPMGSVYDPTLNRDPLPPAPGTTRILTPGEQITVRTWVNSLPPGGLAGGGGPSNPDNAYQMRVAGYPEREVPLPAAATGASGRGLMVDGMRPMDGYAIEAKHVREPDCKKTFRDLDRVDKTLGTPPKIDKNGKVKFDPHRDSMYVTDGNEMARYRAALADPRNDEIRGVEIITNDKRSAPYWQSMMAMSGVTGTARYVP
ncbi:restriction endonuclease fold toxin-2 domain-containing protein [Streptomyces sp. NPDC006208]|uniref:restriction endonuclease fold toxin-2 domain-containing protein n=1 Tax=Streptomyces sp. NPDC006208 TaxID=3156734 RepID=UPI0033A38774